MSEIPHQLQVAKKSDKILTEQNQNCEETVKLRETSHSGQLVRLEEHMNAFKII